MTILIQGNLDRSCGFYSVLNAVSEVNGMSYDRCCDLFWTYVERNPKLAAEGMTRGLFFTQMRDEVVPGIVDLLQPDEMVDFSFPFRNTKHATVAAFGRELRASLSGESTSAIMSFGAPWRHWTTATSVTKSEIILKDSTLCQRKSLRSLALACNNDPYYPKSITLVHARQTILFKKA